MKDVAELLRAIAALLWPVALIALMYALRDKLSALVESARSRRFTLKVAGQELTMEEAGQQQASLIADLQSQVVSLRKTLEGLAKGERPIPGKPLVEAAPRQTSAQAVLWVDDKPKNNSYLVQQLLNQGIEVAIATSTEAALGLLSQRGYQLVISDMGRREGESYNTDAGLDLLDAMRKESITTPVVFYCGPQAAAKFGRRAVDLGAYGVTSSPTDLLRYLNDLGLGL